MTRRVAAAALLLAVAAAGVALSSGGTDDAVPAGAAGPAVVRVSVPDGAAAELTTGFVSGPGRVVTVAHVFAGPEARARVRERGGRTLRARVVALDRRSDLALLAVAGVSSARLRLGTGAEGRTLLVARGGGSLRARVRRQIRARVSEWGARGVRERPALELAAEVAIGDSGAPLVDSEGRVSGVLFARSRARPGVAYAVDASALDALLSAPVR